MIRKLAAAGAGAALTLLAAGTAVASPSPSASPSPPPSVVVPQVFTGSGAAPLGVGPGQEYAIQSSAFNLNTWAESTVAHNWYINPHNQTDVDVEQATDGWHVYHDANNNAECVTMDYGNSGATNKLLDETCVAGKTSQEWLEWNPFGNIWYIENHYMNNHILSICARGQAALVDAQTATAGLNMVCTYSVGPDQYWVFGGP